MHFLLITNNPFSITVIAITITEVILLEVVGLYFRWWSRLIVSSRQVQVVRCAWRPDVVELTILMLIYAHWQHKLLSRVPSEIGAIKLSAIDIGPFERSMLITAYGSSIYHLLIILVNWFLFLQFYGKNCNKLNNEWTISLISSIKLYWCQR